MQNSSLTSSAFIDTLTFTIPSASDMDFDAKDDFDVSLIRGWFFNFLRRFGLTPSNAAPGGRNFYKHCFYLDFHSDVREESAHDLKSVGFVAFGGNSGSACVYLTGFACEYLNLHNLMPVVRSELERLSARITRADTAYDCHDGEYTVDDAVEWWLTDRWTTKGGKPSRYCQHGCWIPGQMSERTFEVGSRQSTKFTRVYEKGQQLGDPDSKWTRFEIEWKSNNGGVIPYDILTNPGKYLKDSYSCLDWIPENDDSPVFGVRYTARKKAQLTVNQYREHCRIQYGKFIRVLAELGFSAPDILSDLSRQGIPSRLVVPPIGCPPPEDSLTW